MNKPLKKYLYIGGALVALYLVFWLISNILWYSLIIGGPLLLLWLWAKHQGWLK